jgi:hypothetical protein
MNVMVARWWSTCAVTPGVDPQGAAFRYDCLPSPKPRIAMQHLTPAGQRLVDQLAQRFGLSHEAVFHMLVAVNNGGGTMAQFNCPELGGSGQWMRGGMTIVGDMFNHGLKAAVDNLCNELASALAREQIFPAAATGSFTGGATAAGGRVSLADHSAQAARTMCAMPCFRAGSPSNPVAG